MQQQATLNNNQPYTMNAGKDDGTVSLDLRNQLADLRGKIQSNEKLEEILQATLGDDDKRNKLKAELDGQAKPAGGNDA